MTIKYICTAFAFLITLQIAAQEKNIETILAEACNFYETVAEAELYFAERYPDLSAYELTSGEHRDGKFVKYMRWKHFWQSHLEENGNLANIPFYNSAANQMQAGESGPFDDRTWTSISNNSYITGQIGLGRTTSMAFHPTNTNIFYVGAAIGGIWRTQDGGSTYEPLGDKLPFLAISSIVVSHQNPDVLYIGIGDHLPYSPQGLGVYKSTNGGQSWLPTALGFEFNDNIRVYEILIHPDNADVLFAATDDGLYKTDDGFSTVSKVLAGAAYDMAFKPNDANTLYVGMINGKLFKSTNNGDDFTELNDFGSSRVHVLTHASNNDLVAAQHSESLHFSYNAGAVFSDIKSLPESGVYAFDPTDVTIIVGGYFEIYKSTNGGDSFTAITNWLGNDGLPLIHVDQRNVFVNPLNNNIIFFCNDGGIFGYHLNLSQFEDYSDGLAITQYYDIAVAQTNAMVISGGSQDNGSMYRTADGTWDDLAPTGDGMMTEIDPTDANTIYWEYQLGAMRRFNGTSNTGISPPGEDGTGAWETPYKLDPNNVNRIIVGYEEVYESTNKGNSWTAISGELAGGNNLNQVAIAPTNGNRIYATQGTTLYVKSIGDNTWVTKSTPAVSWIQDIEVSPNDMNTIYFTNGGYNAGAKVFKSTDAGNTWENISEGLPNVSVEAIETYETVAGGLFLGTDVGVYYTDNELDAWYEYGDLPNSRITDIEIQYSEQLIRIGTYGRGIYEATIDVIACPVDAVDFDDDDVCDAIDVCPFVDDALLGSSCDDNDDLSTGEFYTTDCECSGGIFNLPTCAAQGAGGTGADWINRVQLHTINNSSGQTAYSDFRNLGTTLTESNSYTLTVGLNYSFEPDTVYSWIDYNRNGVFEENEELGMSLINSNHESSATFTVPALADYGVATLRTRVIYGIAGALPCDSYFGEVEDYSVYLKPACIASSTEEILYNGIDDDCDNSTNDFGTSVAALTTLKLKVLLEGAYTTTQMHANLQESGLLPLSQPYSNSPWNYTGQETNYSANTNITDWIMVELMDADYNSIAKRAALLAQNGTVVDVNGFEGVRFLNVDNSVPYYVAVRNRNHLDVISENMLPLNNDLAYDFTNPNMVQQGDNLLAQVGSESYALPAGDTNGNGVITVNDLNEYKNSTSILNEYSVADFNMDGTVSTSDFNFFTSNSSKIGNIQIRY